jgi:hypothetical protein
MYGNNIEILLITNSKTLNPLNNTPYHIVIDRLTSTLKTIPIVVIN